jgi:deoxyribose-phosphate aldolase
MKYAYHDISKMIDHSLLNPSLKVDELEAGCKLAAEYDVASVCIMPYYLGRASELLRDSEIKVGTTIGFPHGGHTKTVKMAEAREAIEEGAEELDMVINISKAMSGDWDYVRDEIGGICDLCHSNDVKLKVIFENCYLNSGQKIMLCEICNEVHVDWIKTSTGYGPEGATDEDLKLMRSHAVSEVQVKAAGGVRSLDRLLEVKKLGVSRVGATRTKEILDEFRRKGE